MCSPIEHKIYIPVNMFFAMFETFFLCDKNGLRVPFALITDFFSYL